MKFFLVRHAQAEDGPELQTDRDLTDTGEAQLPVMAKFLKTQTDKIGGVLCSSDLLRGQKTGEFLAKKLGVDVQYTPWVDPFVPIEKCWKVIQQTAAKLDEGEEIVVVSHGPTVNALAAMLLDSGEGDKFHFAHGCIAHFDTDNPPPLNGFPIDGRGKNVLALMHWMVTPKLANRAMEDDNDAVIGEALRITDELLGVQIDEKGDAYYYDEIEEKRWISSADSCEGCDGNADLGWIDMDDLFTEGDADVDEPPLHPHCDCSVENRTRRVRVYESGRRVTESVLPKQRCSALHDVGQEVAS